MTYDIVIVGSGISGATLAERYATVLNKKVLVLEKRPHIGGNCYDFVDDAGVLVSLYGAHIFHTSFKDVWEYVNTFSSWRPYIHRVVSHVDGKLVPIPVNITTVNQLFGLSLQNEKQMQDFMATQTVSFPKITNSKESAHARVGPHLYEKLFKHYTRKQWDLDPAELDASVLERIPVRYSFDDRYFTDTFQALPTHGYTKLFEKMLSHPNITVKTNIDYFSVKNKIKHFDKLFFTGPIDQFFSYKFGKKLQYRSLHISFETFNKEFFQSHAVINYPNDHQYTRIVEYKHLTGQKHPYTTISKEYPTWQGEPYYPVPSPENRDLYEIYRKEAEKEEQNGIYFVGRLANYKYFNMDQAFKNALELFSRLNPTGN
jgi:UDP-galactopyranose mutase